MPGHLGPQQDHHSSRGWDVAGSTPAELWQQPCGSLDRPVTRPERELAYLRRLEQQRVQGLLVSPVDPESPMLADR